MLILKRLIEFLIYDCIQIVVDKATEVLQLATDKWKVKTMKGKRVACFILYIYLAAGNCEDTDTDTEDISVRPKLSDDTDDQDQLKDENGNKDGNCWMKLDAPKLFKTMDKIDKKYENTRKVIQERFEDDAFDDDMLKKMLSSRGVAGRERTKELAHKTVIPAGMNLGGMLLMRMPSSLVFFHRMKLRNNTIFRVNALHNDIENMLLRAHISLNDIHLMGAYERALTDGYRSKLAYRPTFGELQIFLKDVRYIMEGRYRLIKNRLVIELIISELTAEDAIIEYANKALDNPVIRIERRNIGEFLDRIKTDLDKWVKDYFNDYLIYTSLDKLPLISSLENYDKEKAAALAEYTDRAIQMINKRIRSLGGDHIRTPEFTITTSEGLTFSIHHGCLRGLDTIYRRSVATTVLSLKKVRKVDAIVGFSDLKVTYKYQLSLPTNGPQSGSIQTGSVILKANELTARLGLSLMTNPEVVDINIDSLNQIGPESLTLGGSANILISNFKHILKHEITSIMSNTINYGVNMIKSLPKCTPFPPGITLQETHDSVDSDINSDGIIVLNDRTVEKTENDLKSEDSNDELTDL